LWTKTKNITEVVVKMSEVTTNDILKLKEYFDTRSSSKPSKNKEEKKNKKTNNKKN